MPELRTGMAIRLQGELYIVLDFQHQHMGRGSATTRVRLKNVATGAVKETTLRESDEFEEVRLERRPATYSYSTGDHYHFYDTETYEEIVFERQQIEKELEYLKEGTEVTILYADNVPVGLELPFHVELEVVETDPGLRGDTASGGSKPAKLETGKVIQVPLFIQVGDIVRVDTRTDKYIERVK